MINIFFYDGRNIPSLYKPVIFIITVEYNCFVKKAGTWYSCGEIRLGQGKENARQYLVNHPELAEELERKIRNPELATEEAANADGEKNLNEGATPGTAQTAAASPTQSTTQNTAASPAAAAATPAAATSADQR